MKPTALTPALCLTLCAALAPAQYKVFFHQDFEAADWPAKLEHGHSSSPYTTQIVDLGPRDPATILEGIAPTVIGRRALRFQPHQDDPHLSVINNTVLSRERLGATGAAVYQVDFFLNEESNNHPRIALLAQASDPVAASGNKSYRFYRFGLDEKGRVYFSFTNETPTPVIFRHESISAFNLKRPGWHRFQMRFVGQEEIHLSIDGQATSYSPVTDSTFNYLAAGVMVTRSAGDDSAVYADNLSVYWTQNPEDPPPPSPWSGAEVPGYRLNWNVASLNWLTSPNAAWRDAQTTKKVMFVVFHDDQEAVNQALLNTLTTPEALQVLQRCTLLRINLTDPAGLRIAESFGVSQGPMLMVCDTEGKPRASTPFRPEASWAELFGALSGRPAAAGAPAAAAATPAAAADMGAGSDVPMTQ